ncbi:solute carrier family 23 member 1-like isoform X2 [Mytilus galloprovincialis]|uniref:solute carrier family 23 member 1-like isoform X2 n=1 Tax=Mytilus galloprovincialis TaxID=29158 RepID=UPI003F7C9F47
MEKDDKDILGKKPSIAEQKTQKINVGNEKIELEIEDNSWKLLYKVSDSPPFYMTLLFALQQTLMVLPFCVMSAIMVAQSVCAEDDNDLKTQLLSTTIFLSAVCTFLQTTFGVRLPVYQGPTPAYIVPLLVISGLPDWKCEPMWNKVIFNATTGENFTTDEPDIVGYREKIALPKLRAMQGSLILAGGIHMLIGLTGLVGVLLNVVGPLTVVPTLLLLGIELNGVMNTFCEPQWGVSAGTCLISIILAVYLNGWNMPLPMYTRGRGCHIVRYPLQQVLAILFAILIGWSVCGILTYAGALTSDPNDKQYKTRTDFGADTIERTPWATVPYPGQFGNSEFNTGIFLAFFLATLLSVIESIADYYACARLSHLPPPPLSAMNRGIMMEGFMSMIAGFFGAGHATTTYSNNIGLIGMTRFVDINLTRNMAVVGVSMLTGLMVPNWVKENSTAIKTGSDEFDKFLMMTLTNPSFFGGFVAFILDNTLKGTKRERGLAAWALGESQSVDTQSQIEEDLDVYEIPIFTKYLNKIPCMKYLPIFPTYTPENYKCRKQLTSDKEKQ